MAIAVASVPEGHVYVRHLSDPSGTDEVRRLPDPRPSIDAPMAQWWPPVMLAPSWVVRHSSEFDLMHIHFGFDACSPDDLRALVSALAAVGKPLVLTVHDLRNPHHVERALHDAQLDVLVRAASALITLTPGAAAEIKARWGRDSLVLPHPHVVAEPWMSAERAPRDRFAIGVHVKSLRASMSPLPVVRALLAVVPELEGAQLRVDAHTDVMTPGYDRYVPEMAKQLHEASDRGWLELHVHDCFSDDELFEYLMALDLSVLPYTFGTHSGWLEACHDLGTAVLAPECGYYAQQRPCLTYSVEDPERKALGLQDAVRRAYDERPAWRADPKDRLAERARVASEHRRLYSEVLREGASCMSS